jgi:hypothetical protein
VRANFLRRPQGATEVLADAVRVLGLIGVLVAWVWWQPTDAGIAALALPALVVPRFLGVRGSADLVSCLIVLVAAWSNVLDLYRTVVGWDLLVHFACTAVLAAWTYLALAHVGIVPPHGTPGFSTAGALVLTTALGLALSVVWEVIEWAGWRFVSDAIFVTYEDTIGDMVVGGLGAAAAGLLLGRVRLLRRPAAAPA